jgi:glycosyltransferase involved in cell wall biosynthesis
MRRSPSDAVAETLVVPLAGGSARATDAVRRLVGPDEPVVFPLAQLANGGRRVLRDRRYERLALVGEPPREEIGYGLSALIALLARPRHVALVDLEREQAVSEPLLGYLARSAPFAAAQLMASLAALAAQRVAIPAARRPRRQKAGRQELKKLLYLRPAVGSAAAVGGSVTHSHEVIRALRAEGVEVNAYTTDPAIAETAALEPEPPCRWQVARTPRAMKAIPASAAAGGDAALVRAALSAARRADVIYQRHARFSLGGALLARISGKPLFLEYNGSERFKGRYWTATPLHTRLAACEDAALAAAARIFVVSEADHRSLLERGVGPERIVVNPNGVDAERFALGGRSEIRSLHGIDADCIVFGFAGTFGPWHGAPEAARAFTEAAKSLPRAHLLLVGDGPELDTTRSIVRDAGLGSRATVTGQVPPSQVPAYLDACDVLVSPHVPLPDGIEFFGSPTKLFEYMAAGKAIIASRLGQIGDVLEHGVTAWLVEPGDVAGLAEALLTLAETPEIRRELGAQARRQAIERHSWQRNASRVIDAYTSFAQEAI